VIKRTVPLLLLAAVALPIGAAAQKVDVTGPATFVGAGPVQGELTAADGPKRIRFRLAGSMTFTDLADDMQVVCRGNGQMHAGNKDGKLVVQCRGRVLAVVSASHLGFAGRGRRYGIQIPEGVSGTIEGRFQRQGDRPAERPAAPAEPEAPAER